MTHCRSDSNIKYSSNAQTASKTFTAGEKNLDIHHRVEQNLHEKHMHDAWRKPEQQQNKLLSAFFRPKATANPQSFQRHSPFTNT